MPNVTDLIGQTFGSLTILERVDNDHCGKTRWRCSCALCGNENDVRTTNVLTQKMRPATKCRICANKREPTDFRFDKFLVVDPDHSWGGTNCILWTGSTTRQGGYGRFSIGGKMILAHRHAYERAKGSIPGGKFAIHQCDNPCCCNPKHLRLGDNDENMKDMARKGRSGGQKLSNADVRRIRLNEEGLANRVWAERLGVDRTTVWAARTGRTHRFVRITPNPFFL